MKDLSINAFAMPGGVIGVHTGLFLSSNSESELASVLGHEIGHVTQRHLARILAKQRQILLKILQVLPWRYWLRVVIRNWHLAPWQPLQQPAFKDNLITRVNTNVKRIELV